MKRLAVLLCGLAATLGVVTTAGPASADTTTPAVLNCDGYTLVSANYVTDSGGHRYGAIQLCRSGDSYFAIYINYGTMPSGHWANAWLDRYVNGVWDGGNWSCDSPLPGANKRVRPTETWCRGPWISAGTDTRITFRATGYYYRDPSTVPVGRGLTARCNWRVGCFAE